MLTTVNNASRDILYQQRCNRKLRKFADEVQLGTPDEALAVIRSHLPPVEPLNPIHLPEILRSQSVQPGGMPGSKNCVNRQDVRDDLAALADDDDLSLQCYGVQGSEAEIVHRRWLASVGVQLADVGQRGRQVGVAQVLLNGHHLHPGFI